MTYSHPAERHRSRVGRFVTRRRVSVSELAAVVGRAAEGARTAHVISALGAGIAAVDVALIENRLAVVGRAGGRRPSDDRKDDLRRPLVKLTGRLLMTACAVAASWSDESREIRFELFAGQLRDDVRIEQRVAQLGDAEHEHHEERQHERELDDALAARVRDGAALAVEGPMSY